MLTAQRSPTPPRPLDDVLTVARWLSEITLGNLNEVSQRLLAECHFVGHNVCEAAKHFRLDPHVWNDRLLEFYSQTDGFLFETATWNATAMKQEMRQVTCDFLTQRLPRGSRILCYGDGMGFDSAAIAQLGFDVTCYDVSGPGLLFARRFFDLNQVQVAIETRESELGQHLYDAVVCLDVLEHLPEPIATVEKFAQWLNPSGLLISHAPFYHVDSTRPTHLRTNRQYSGSIRRLYGGAGFRVLESGGPLLNPLLLQKCSPVDTTPFPRRNIQLRLAQAAVWIAKYLPGVPAFVASFVCKPNDDWPRLLRQKLNSQCDSIPVAGNES